MRVAIITANTDIYKGTKANESGEAVKLDLKLSLCGHFHWTEKYCQLL